jgi:predicted amidohydrolase YtcJ
VFKVGYRHKYIIYQIYILLSIFFLMKCTVMQKEADLVIYGGTIYTMDEERPTVQAVAVKNEKISYLGSKESVSKRIGPNTNVLDLQGRIMIPGLIESHGHLMGMGYSKMRLDLGQAKNYQELIELVAEEVKKSKPGEWIIGRGWHQSKWNPQPKPLVRGFQSHIQLSKISPNNPVYLTHASGHAGFANAAAMKIAAISTNSQFSGDGEIIKDHQGQPTGIFIEEAQNLITKHIPRSTPEGNQKALALAVEECLKNGITTFHDAGAGDEQIELYKEFLREGKLKVRLWVMLNGGDSTLLEKYYKIGPVTGLGNKFLTIRAIKLFADGALGSRGAWLLESYADRPGHFGHATIPPEKIFQVACQALMFGFQVCTHAIGDRANQEVLNQYQRAFEFLPEKAGDHRFRIEHAQHLSLTDIPRFSELGVIASMQAIHLSSDRPWAIDRLGQQRINEGAYVWQKLIKSGAIMVNGTDVPVEPINPIECFYAAVTRKTLTGYPPDGFEPEQRLTRKQALQSYTILSAYAGFEENIKGSIEVGKLADFTVLSQDILKIPENQILNTTVDYTILDGKVAYERDSYKY